MTMTGAAESDSFATIEMNPSWPKQGADDVLHATRHQILFVPDVAVVPINGSTLLSLKLTPQEHNCRRPGY